MERTKIHAVLQSDTPLPSVLVKGWVRTRRDAKDFVFLEVNDGSALANIQIVAAVTLPNYAEVARLTTGSAVSVIGELVPSPGAEQRWEIAAHAVEIIHATPESYPLQKKRHTDEYLRTIAHLRPRTNKYGAIFRIRAEMAYAIHTFFHERGFRYVHTPIITGSDCEGAGKMFQVTTLELEKPPRGEDGGVDYTQDFFGKPAYLTVSGQLEAEMLALALGDVYTFGPTFRAENSVTRRHAAEFWMVEPEMTFCDLTGDMAVAEAFVKYLAQHALAHCHEDLTLFHKFVEPKLFEQLQLLVESDFVHLPYTEAVDILQKSGETFEFPPAWGSDLQTEHERYLTETHFKGPIIVINYPKTIKPFYMRVNDDGKTVAAMDVLVPMIGEIIGGSQREERLDMLEARLAALQIDPANYWWYLDSRRYGSVPHSGFGLGFERLLMLITGVNNIRDVIPFSRTPNNLEF